jgi:hypothetical protein
MTSNDAEEYAETIVQAAQQVDGVALDYSAASLEDVDRIIEGFRQEGLSVEQIADTLFGFGCYVGEVVIRNLGGQWKAGDGVGVAVFDESDLLVELAERNACNPIGKVFKRFENGEADSVVLFYKMVQHQIMGTGGEAASALNQQTAEEMQQLGFIGRTIVRLGWEAGARRDAITFVIGVQGSIARIDAEIESRVEIKASLGESGPMAPGASPRIWHDNYVGTLRELRSTILSMMQEGKTWGK